MTAQELRIGNLITFNGKEFKVIALAENDVCINGFGGIAENFEPIPLTEDWFLKFGFLNCKKNGSNYFSDSIDDPNNATIRFAHPDSDWIYSVGDDDHGIVFNKINYVHQLQNLYFALTGNELTLNK
jgi:hypothetical protein